jgi:hypothetical protein
MELKENVSLTGLRNQITDILSSVEQCFIDNGYDLTITCTTGGHPRLDPHTWGFAIDCRVHNIPIDKQQKIHTQLQQKLGSDYTVLLEDSGGPNEHIHIQWRKNLWRLLVHAEGHSDIPLA